MSCSSEWSSGCESGWTLYLDHSVSSSPSPSCFRDSDGFDNRRRSKNLGNQSYVHHQEEEEDLSMISDASSGPRNIYEEGSVKNLKNVDRKTRSKRERERRDHEKMNSLLDDTASSHMLQKSVGGGNKIEQTFPESTLDYSQGFSATHLQDKTAFQEQYGYLHTEILNNQLAFMDSRNGY